jgi:hypothetical protein
VLRSCRRVTLVVLVAAAVSLLLTACSGSVSIGGSPSPTATGPVTFTNDQYGFSITHDAKFTQGKSKNGVQAGSGPVYDVIFADHNGARSADAYLDAIDVSVYELAREIKPSEVPKLKTELQGMLDQVMSPLTDVKVLQPLTRIDVNGVPGFVVKYTYTEAGEPVTITSLFLFKGKYEYQLATQAASKNWDALKSKFESAVQSFTVK